MKNFDLIDSASYGYKKVWDERRYLLRLALVPVFIKLICTIIIFVLGYQNDYLSQALVSLPGLFAEGWLLAQFLRTIFLLERWPIHLKEQPSGKILDALLIRARGIMSATILYTLIDFLGFGLKAIYSYFYTILDGQSKNGAATGEETDPIFFIPALALIYLSVWAFRLLWLYIPVSVLMPLPDFLRKTAGFVNVLRMLGVFLIGMVPCFVAAIILSNIFAGLVGGPDTDIGKFILVIITVLVGTFINLITTAAMAYVFRDVVPHHPAAFQETVRK